jgi:hypothetical protein
MFEKSGQLNGGKRHDYILMYGARTLLELEAPGSFDGIPRCRAALVDQVEAQKCNCLATDGHCSSVQSAMRRK